MAPGWLPAEDRVRSPHTGWVRAHWEAVADHVLGAVVAHTSAEGSLVTMSPHQDTSTGLEGFARGALLAAYRLAGTDEDAVRAPLAAWLARGLDAGTRPAVAGRWPRPADRHQSIVEAAWIAVALAETREAVWDRLDEHVRRRVARWLADVHGKAVYDNNWLLYPVVVDGFLSTVAGPHDPAATATALRRVEAMYRGEGWYSDGPGSCFGHYSAWGMHLLLAHWLRITGADAYPGGATVLRERLHAFLGEYARLIGPDGTPVLHGRSLVYRYAAAAPFWLKQPSAPTP